MSRSTDDYGPHVRKNKLKIKTMSCVMPSAIVTLDDFRLLFHDHTCTSVSCYRIAVGYYRTPAQNNKTLKPVTSESSIQKFPNITCI